MTCQMQTAGGVAAQSSGALAQDGDGDSTATAAVSTSASGAISSGTKGQGQKMLTRKHAHALLDDLLGLVPMLFAQFARCAEVDEAVHKHLAESVFSASSGTVPSEQEGELINSMLKQGDKPWKRIPGTVEESVE